jgi:hypothetical protein
MGTIKERRGRWARVIKPCQGVGTEDYIKVFRCDETPLYRLADIAGIGPIRIARSNLIFKGVRKEVEDNVLGTR